MTDTKPWYIRLLIEDGYDARDFPREFLFIGPFDSMDAAFVRGDQLPKKGWGIEEWWIVDYDPHNPIILSPQEADVIYGPAAIDSTH